MGFDTTGKLAILAMPRGATPIAGVLFAAGVAYGMGHIDRGNRYFIGEDPVHFWILVFCYFMVAALTLSPAGASVEHWRRIRRAGPGLPPMPPPDQEEAT